MSLKLTTILGARPQFIKASALSRRVAEFNANDIPVEESIVHTGQHYDIAMSDVFFSELAIPQPTLRLAASGEDRPGRFAAMIDGLGAFLRERKPDVVLVFGDTDTTMAGALTASQLGIPVAHVEAGLRSFNRAMPEENNRVLTDHLSQFLFCPTATAVDNLAAEGVTASKTGGTGRPIRISRCGDIQLETLRHYAGVSLLSEELEGRIGVLAKGGPYALATVHRAESTASADRLGEILRGIAAVAATVPVVVPLHPGTRRKMDEYGLSLDVPNVLVLPPVGFLEMIALLDGCSLVMTDSGGLQKEAYFMKRPCLTMREETEWVELVDSGFNRLSGIDAARIEAGAISLLEGNFNWSVSLYGEGDTSKIVLESLIRELGC